MSTTGTRTATITVENISSGIAERTGQSKHSSVTLKLAELIDVKLLQSLVNDFYELAHIPMSIINTQDEVLVGVGWQEICTKFHRVHPETCKNCLESDTKLSAGVASGEYKLYRCKNSMWDVATPVIVADQHVGNVFSGQFFFKDEPLDYEVFRNQAQRYGFNEKQYLAALESVPRLTRDQVRTGMSFLTKLANMVSQMGYTNFMLARTLQEREQAELALRESRERLRQSEERLRAAAVAADIGVWHWKPGTSYVEVSANWRTLFGVGPDVPVTFETWSNCLHPEDRDRAVNELNAASDSHREFNTEYRVLLPDGNVRWIVDRGRAYYDENGRAISMAGVNVDISKQKWAQEALIRSEKLASVGRMAATVAHEINNPLEAVTNCIYLAKSNSGLEPRTKEHLDIAERELQRVAHIARQTLGFYRENTKSTVVDLGTLVHEVTNLYGPKLSQKEIRVKIEHESDSRIIAVAGEIRQVISNLLTNAIDASFPKHRIRIRTGRVTLNGTQFTRLTVADTGSGILRAHRDQLFNPFFTTKQAVGTGLGLWVSKEIVVKHGGHIRLRSLEGRGTVFCVFLPSCTPLGVS